MNSKIRKIIRQKGRKPIVALTSYTASISKITNKYCDIILVGDSVGTVMHGMKTTREVDIDMMVLHAKSVMKESKNALVVVDMPYKSYLNKFEAYKNASKIIKLTNCHALKLEGGKDIINVVKYLINKKIPIMGHIGLLPQETKGQFTVKGKNIAQKKRILEDAILLEKAGVFSIVIECVVEDLAKKITKIVNIPTIGIGASKYCDGQVLVVDDIIGMSNFYPKFVKKYANVNKIVERSIKKYSNEVRSKKFPSIKNTYKN